MSSSLQIILPEQIGHELVIEQVISLSAVFSQILFEV